MVEPQPSKLVMGVRFPSPAPAVTGVSAAQGGAAQGGAGRGGAGRGGFDPFLLAPVIFLVLWSSGFICIKIGLAYADPLTFLALRYALVLACLAPAIALWRPRRPRGREWRDLVVVGLLIQFGYFAGCYLSEEFGLSASGLALITSLQPILVALLAPVIVGGAVGGRHWLGLALGLVGTVVVIVSRAGVGQVTAAGLLWAGLALAGMTAGTLYEKRTGPAHHPLSAITVQYAVGFVVTLGFAAALEPMRVRWTAPLLGALSYLVLANSLVAVSLLLAMIRRGAVARVSALFFLVPPAAAVIAWLLTGEGIPPFAWLGMALAAAGVALVARPARRPAPACRGTAGESS